MFEDIIGGVDKKKDDVANVIVGDGVVTCPACGSDNIQKGPPVYLLNKKQQQRCNCNSCNIAWSLTYNPLNKRYEFELHKK